MTPDPGDKGFPKWRPRTKRIVDLTETVWVPTAHSREPEERVTQGPTGTRKTGTTSVYAEDFRPSGVPRRGWASGRSEGSSVEVGEGTRGRHGASFDTSRLTAQDKGVGSSGSRETSGDRGPGRTTDRVSAASHL